MKTDRPTKSLTDLAERLGISRQTIHKYARMKGFPRAGRSGFDVAAVGEFLLAHSRKGDLASRDLLKILRARKVDLENKLLELRVAEARGELMPRAEHLDKISVIGRAFRRALDTVAARVAAVARDPKLSALVRAECEAACQAVRAELGGNEAEDPPQEKDHAQDAEHSD